MHYIANTLQQNVISLACRIKCNISEGKVAKANTIPLAMLKNNINDTKEDIRGQIRGIQAIIYYLVIEDNEGKELHKEEFSSTSDIEGLIECMLVQLSGGDEFPFDANVRVCIAEDSRDYLSGMQNES